jgi:hypothetical protein
MLLLLIAFNQQQANPPYDRQNTQIIGPKGFRADAFAC